MTIMRVRKRSDGRVRVLEGTDTGEAYVVLCGVTEAGVVTPIRGDDDGKIILSA